MKILELFEAENHEEVFPKKTHKFGA